jgi:uncharacterized protein (UPF0212 family)
MDTIFAPDLLDAWERGRNALPGERGLLLLSVAKPEVPVHELAATSVGRRDAALLALRERAFGPRMTGLASCPRCSESLEMEFSVADIVVRTPADVPATLSLAEGAYRVEFRLPTAEDMVALARANPRQASEQVLLERCILEAWEADVPRTAVDLPDEVLEAVAASMAEADPQAEVELSLTCPACGSRWQALFDIVSFLWREIDAWAARILREVHTLASVYGWSERDILALSPQRRQYYLELMGG